MVSVAAERLGSTEDAARYAGIAANVSKAFNAHFYDASNYTYVVRVAAHCANTAHVAESMLDSFPRSHACMQEPHRVEVQELSVQTTISLADDLGLIPIQD